MKDNNKCRTNERKLSPFDLPQPLYDMNDETLKHLTDHLIGTLD